MRRLYATILALGLMTGITAVSSGAAHANVPRQGTVTLNYTVNYTCVSGPCGTPGAVYTHTYTITADCGSNAFTGTGTYVGFPTNEVVTGSTTPSGGITYTSTYPIAGNPGYFVTVTGAFTTGNNFSGTATDFLGANFTVVGTFLSQTGQCYANHGQYVKASGGGDEAGQSTVGMPIQSNKP